MKSLDGVRRGEDTFVRENGLLTENENVFSLCTYNILYTCPSFLCPLSLSYLLSMYHSYLARSSFLALTAQGLKI